jgi:hypothetical protein
VRASQLVELKWGKNQTINRAANKENEVRAKNYQRAYTFSLKKEKQRTNLIFGG